ncbi:Ger(x)C family spore germination C-terminal domain-containing protein [Bacillus dakarensis]|uniref:Ger(x)C family spore germination C-terminal domain-containing protein n=1 Tax=Robertmurraya dakarensis TaxID=1926278 RepID=UPI0012B6A451|nr:Ger(x)C family spore germination C-terminal domain-containing protein [Bacillus dakarensis]
MGLIWLKKSVKNSTFSVKPEGEDGKITMTPTLGSVKMRPEIENGQWIMNLKVVVEGSK